MIEPNGKIEFTYQHTDGAPKVSMSLHPDSDLDHVLDAFQMFLYAAGYNFSGQLCFDGNVLNQNAEEN